MQLIRHRPVVVKLLRLVGIALLFLAVCYSTLVNGFGAANWDEWDLWQIDSDAIVLNRVEADLAGRDEGKLGLLREEGEEIGKVHQRIGIIGFPDTPQSAAVKYVPYESMIGGQAHAISYIWRHTSCSTISCFHVVNSALFAVVAVAMFVGIASLGSRGLAWAWIVSVIASPWMAVAGRNLYWSPWLWFLPALAAIALTRARTIRWRSVAAAALFLAFAAKYLISGFEIFTSVTLLAAAMPLLAALMGGSNFGSWARQGWNVVIVGCASGLAFALALAFQAQLLAGSLAEGLKQIWVDAVLRRGYGNAEEFDPVYATSLQSSPVDVVLRYVTPEWWWRTDLLAFSVDWDGDLFSVSLGGSMFFWLILLSGGIVLARAIQGDHLWIRDASLLVIGFCVAVSWFIAAKGHSFIHTHVLFVLWYFLFVPAMLFVISSFAWEKRHVIARMRSFSIDILLRGSSKLE